MQDLTQITADKATAREKLFAVFDYYQCWLTCETFHGCIVHPRAVRIWRVIAGDPGAVLPLPSRACGSFPRYP